MMKVLIADDELQARKRLHRLLEGFPDVEVGGEARDGKEVLARIAEERFDVVLLDVRMPHLSGVEAMALWPAGGPRIVFTTAHADHAVDAFEGGAVDFVLKPVEAARLRKALDRVKERAAAEDGAEPGRVALSTPSGLLLFSPEEVVSAVIEGACVVVETDRGRVHTDLPLGELEARIPGLRRVHRQALVNFARVTRLQDNGSGGYVAHADSGARVAVSRSHARELRRELGH